MHPNRDEIKKWLKENNLSYEWLAGKCFVSYNTVRNWMAKQPIPKAKLALLQEIMLPDQNAVTTLPNMDERGKTFLYLGEETQREVFAEAARLNMDVSTYCTLAVEWCCEQEDIGDTLKKMIEEENRNRPEFRVAEEPAAYGNSILPKDEVWDEKYAEMKKTLQEWEPDQVPHPGVRTKFARRYIKKPVDLPEKETNDEKTAEE